MLVNNLRTKRRWMTGKQRKTSTPTIQNKTKAQASHEGCFACKQNEEQNTKRENKERRRHQQDRTRGKAQTSHKPLSQTKREKTKKGVGTNRTKHMERHMRHLKDSSFASKPKNLTQAAPHSGKFAVQLMTWGAFPQRSCTRTPLHLQSTHNLRWEMLSDFELRGNEKSKNGRGTPYKLISGSFSKRQ